MSETPRFKFAGRGKNVPFPFCVIDATSSEVLDIINNGDPDGPDFGIVEGLTLAQVCEFYWNKETIKVNLSASYGAVSFSGGFDILAEQQPNERVCGQSTGFFSGDSGIPPSPIDGDEYIAFDGNWLLDGPVTPVIFNTDTEDYAILFSFRITATGYIYNSGAWMGLAVTTLTTQNPNLAPITQTVNTFSGVSTGFHPSGDGGVTLTLADFTDESDFTYPAP